MHWLVHVGYEVDIDPLFSPGSIKSNQINGWVVTRRNRRATSETSSTGGRAVSTSAPLQGSSPGYDLHIATAAAFTYMRRGCTSVVHMAQRSHTSLAVGGGLVLSEQRCTAGLAFCAVQRDLRPRDQCCSRCEEDNGEMEQERCTCRQVLVAAHVLRGVGTADETHVRSVEALTEALRVCDQPFNWSRGGR
jgi:hypothetical protein